MNHLRRRVVLVAATVSLVLTGCAAPKVDFSKIERPERASQLDAYDVFVGAWDWKAEMLNAEGPDRMWTGRAEWKWALDRRCLQGEMSAKSAHAEFAAAGIWSWHPKSKKYIWWMFNNWGYPQEGTATYDADERSWEMPYRSVGFDGTPSYGLYRMKAVNNDTLEWRMDEWVDFTRMIKKMEMTGTYTRRK